MRKKLIGPDPRAIAPTPAPQSAGSVHFGSSKVYPIYIDTNTQDHVP